MAKGEVKKGRKKVDGSIISIAEWKRSTDEWRRSTEELNRRNDEWKRRMSIWKDDVDGWRSEFGDWRRNMSVEFACMKEELLWIKENMYTKQEHYEYMAKIDAMLGEVQESRRERQVQGCRYSTMDDQLDNHEKRIGVLEKKI